MEEKDDNSQKYQNQQNSQEETIPFQYKTFQSSKYKPNIKLNLKVIEESEENNIANEEESLGYKSNFNFEKKSDPKKENTPFTRKFSNVSTNFTENLPEISGFCPLTNLNKNENSSSHIFFGREKNNKTPMNEYFNGVENYFKEKNPEKNEYQKSNNYIKKDVYYKRYFTSSKQINSFRSFDLTEDSKNIFNNIKQTTTPKHSTDILSNLINYLDDVDDKNIKTTSSKQKEIPTVPKIPKINPLSTMNITKGKFDMPVYYYGYIPVNCKYYFY